MKSISRFGHYAFARIANKKNAKMIIIKNVELNFDEPCKNDNEIILWHADYGKLLIKSPNDKSLLGLAISSVLEEKTNSRDKIHDFTHVGIYEKQTKKIYVYLSSKERLQEWKENINVDVLEKFVLFENAECVVEKDG
jgi:hypothetical protein